MRVNVTNAMQITQLDDSLGDVDDDVRAVSASVLIPVVDQFVTHCPDRLLEVVRVLWNGMRDVKDDLSASTASIMDLVAKLFSFDVVLFELQRAQTMHPDLALTNLVPCLLSFFRHTIRSVRLAVLRTISTFLSVPQLDKSWVNTALLQMVWQNMLLEEKEVSEMYIA
jgi:TATA-binding protein-associated factor